MADDRPFGAEFEELGKIDFLLDQLARAVERGEVHRVSYDLLAPRYLARRHELVATIAGRPQPRPIAQPASVASASATHPVPALDARPDARPGARPEAGLGMRPQARPETAPAPRPVPRPVEWTTVLLFLGAFLVIVASAIFSVLVWNQLAATGKLVLLGTVTIGFYAAGSWVRTKLDVPAGATALTAVASAMLLFDGWIAIRGYDLQGALPWAVLLLVCSSVYWFTEVRLAQRFYGVVGAAAQMGWWWLLGYGLGLPVILRLAGMALVALVWQAAAERGRANEVLRPLAIVLEWAAPIATAVLGLGVVIDALLLRTTGPTEVAAAAVVAAAGWYTLARTTLLGQDARRTLAALIQAPLFLSIVVARVSGAASWWLVGALAGAALAYGVFAIVASSRGFASLSVVSQLLAVAALLDVLDAEPRLWVLAIAALVAAWHAAVERLRSSGRAGALSVVLEWAAPIVVVVLSLIWPVVVAESPSASWLEVAAAASIAVVAWVVVVRSRELKPQAAVRIAAALQVSLFAVIAFVRGVQPASWWYVAALGAMALAYGVFALLAGGRAFAVLAVVAELSMVASALDVADAEPRVWIAVVAGLAAVWALASRISRHVAATEEPPPGAAGLADVARVASLVVLVICSLLTPTTGQGLALTGVDVVGADAALTIAVLAAWAAAAVMSRGAAELAGSAVFSLYLCAAVLAWLVPAASPAWFALGLLAVAATWLAASRPLASAYSAVFVLGARWFLRAVAAAAIALGIAVETARSGAGAATPPAAVLALAGAALFAADSLAFGTTLSAAAAGALAVLAATLAAASLEPLALARAATALAAPATALTVTAGIAMLAHRRGKRQMAAAVSAAALASGVTLVAWGRPGWLAIALMLASAAWAACAIQHDERFSLLAGLSALGAVTASAAALGAGTWPTVALVGGASLLVGGISFFDGFGPGGEHAQAGAGGALAALAGLAALSAVVFLERYGAADRAWLAFGAAEQAVLLLFAAASVLLQGRRWNVEAGTYIGWGLVVLSAWTSWGGARSATGEWYTTTLALYLAAMGYSFLARDRERAFPGGLDIASVLIGLGLPLLWTLVSGPGQLIAHFLWVFGLSIAFIAAGIVLRVRWYFFGGVVALVLVAAYRSFTALAEFSWLLLGLIGVVMLVIAVTWEQQRSTRERLVESFQGWR